MLVIAGATASNIPTWIPKNETSTKTVELVKNPEISSTGMFKIPTIIPSKNTAHSISV